MSEEIDYEFESEKLLRGIEKELIETEKTFKEEQTELEELARQEKILRDQLKRISVRKAKFENSVFDHRVRLRKLRNDELPEAERRLNIEKNNARQKQDLKDKELRFDEVTENCIWRKSIFTHQLDGAHFMASAERCIVADAMGTGKTIETIAALDMSEAKRVLVVCPGDVMTSFSGEFKKWAPNRIVMVLGKKPKAVQKMLLETFRTTTPEFVVIINYETWYKNKSMWNWLIDCHFDTVVVDEAHTIKEIDGLPYKGVYKIAMTPNWCDTHNTAMKLHKNGYYFCDQFSVDGCETSSTVKRFFALTGTPILNKPSEIYPLLHIAKPELFGTKADFRRTFTHTTADGKEEWTFDGEARLAKMISGMYIRRTLADTGIVLPPQELVVHGVSITEEEYKLQYKFLWQLFNDAAVQIEDGRAATVTSILSLISRQRQGTVWPGGVWMNIPKVDDEGEIMYEENPATGDLVMLVERVHVGKDYPESAKLDKAVDLYHELVEGGHRVIFFSQFKEPLKELKRRIGDELAEFHGEVNAAKRDEIKRNFDASIGEEPKWKGMAAHYGVGGVGVTFTAATAIIILDEEWNEGKSNQAYDRIHRIGQTKETQVHILRHVRETDESGEAIGLPSIDDWMVALRDRKANIVSGFNMSMDDVMQAFGKGK